MILQQLADHAPVAADDRHGTALGGVELFGDVDAEAVVDGGREVFGAVRVAGGPFGAGIGGADGSTAADAAAADQHRERGAPVVAAGVVVDARRAAELAGDYDQRA